MSKRSKESARKFLEKRKRLQEQVAKKNSPDKNSQAMGNELCNPRGYEPDTSDLRKR